VTGPDASYEGFAVPPDGSATPRHQKIHLRKTQERRGLPPKVLRLKTSPIVCFQQLTSNFNRTMLRLNISSSEYKSKGGDRELRGGGRHFVPGLIGRQAGGDGLLQLVGAFSVVRVCADEHFKGEFIFAGYSADCWLEFGG
jgi:hypothetical protein